MTPVDRVIHPDERLHLATEIFAQQRLRAPAGGGRRRQASSASSPSATCWRSTPRRCSAGRRCSPPSSPARMSDANRQFVEIPPDFALRLVPVPAHLVGKTLAEARLPQTLGARVMEIRRRGPEGRGAGHSRGRHPAGGRGPAPPSRPRRQDGGAGRGEGGRGGPGAAPGGGGMSDDEERKATDEERRLLGRLAGPPASAPAASTCASSPRAERLRALRAGGGGSAVSALPGVAGGGLWGVFEAERDEHGLTRTHRDGKESHVLASLFVPQRYTFRPIWISSTQTSSQAPCPVSSRVSELFQ